MPEVSLSDRENTIVVYAALVAVYGEFSPQAEDWAIKYSDDPDMFTALEQTVILVKTVVPVKGKWHEH